MTLEEIRKALDGVTADLTYFRAGTKEHPYLELAAAKRAINTSIATLKTCIEALDELTGEQDDVTDKG